MESVVCVGNGLRVTFSGTFLALYMWLWNIRTNDSHRVGMCDTYEIKKIIGISYNIILNL